MFRIKKSKIIHLFLFLLYSNIISSKAFCNSGPLYGLSGFNPGPWGGSNGYTITGDGFLNVDLNLFNGYIVNNNSTLIASTFAYNPSSRLIYFQEVVQDKIYLKSINVDDGKINNISILSNPFRTMVYDPVYDILTGLSGDGDISVGEFGFLVSAKCINVFDLKTNKQSGCLYSDTGNYVSTAVALDYYSHIMYMEKIENDGPHLISFNLKTYKYIDLGRITDKNNNNLLFGNFVFSQRYKCIFGVTGKGSPTINSYGFLLSGSHISTLFVDSELLFEKGRATQIFEWNGTYSANAIAIDDKANRIYLQEVRNDGAYLIGYNLFSNIDVNIKLKNQFKYNSISLVNPPPSDYTLAKMCEIVYDNGPDNDNHISIDGYDYYYVVGSDPVPTFSDECTGFYAETYKNGNQVVLAIRGTEINNIWTILHNLLADSTWLALMPITDSLAHQVEQACIVLRNIFSDNKFKNCNITLTGHSLGGSIAMILGLKTGLPTTAFNSFNVNNNFIEDQSIINSLSFLDGIEWYNSGKIVNIRTWGDIVSSLGDNTMPFEQNNIRIYTVKAPDGSAYDHRKGYFSNVLDYHSIKNMVLDLQNGAVQNEGYNVPIEEIISGIPSQTRMKIDLAKYLVKKGIAYAISVINPPNIKSSLDLPSEFSGYMLTTKKEPLKFSTITLPTISGVSSFEVSLFQNTSWSRSLSIKPGTFFSFDNPVDSIAFWPLDDKGDNVQINNDFFFDVSFNCDGQFTGTLEKLTTSPGIIPEKISKNDEKKNNMSCFINTLM